MCGAKVIKTSKGNVQGTKTRQEMTTRGKAQVPRATLGEGGAELGRPRGWGVSR